jgi:hypothetical protein
MDCPVPVKRGSVRVLQSHQNVFTIWPYIFMCLLIKMKFLLGFQYRAIFNVGKAAHVGSWDAVPSKGMHQHRIQRMFVVYCEGTCTCSGEVDVEGD